MRTQAALPSVAGEPFVDAREAAYTMNLPMYYLTNARQRNKLLLPHYRIGCLVRFKLSELATWQSQSGGQVVGEHGRTEEVTDD